jgi:hypothetical protein
MIFPEGLPPGEECRCQSIGNAFFWIDLCIQEFDMSLRLFEHASLLLQHATNLGERNQPYPRWRFVAARDCALIVYDFGSAIRCGLQNLGPVLGKLIDPTKYKEANKLFDCHFENFEKLRHGATHADEQHKVGGFDKHSVRAAATESFVSGSGALFSGTMASFSGSVASYKRGAFAFGPEEGRAFASAIDDRVFSVSLEREQYTLDITEARKEKMTLVRDAYHGAFFTLEEETRKARAAEWAKRQQSTTDDQGA